MCANPTPSTSETIVKEKLLFADDSTTTMPSCDPSPATLDDVDHGEPSFTMSDTFESSLKAKIVKSTHDIPSSTAPVVHVNGRRPSATSYVQRDLTETHSEPPPPSSPTVSVKFITPFSEKVRRFVSLNSLRHVSSESSTARLLEEKMTESAKRRSRIVSEGEQPLHEVATFSEFDQSARILDKKKLPARKPSVKKYYKHQDSLRQHFIDDERMIEQYMQQKKVVAQARGRMMSGNLSNVTGTIKESDYENDDARSESSGLVVVPYQDTVEKIPSGPVENEDYVHVENATARGRKKVRMLSQLSFVVNIFLLAIKIVAVALTGSYAIISSLVDSCVDLTSGSVIWYTERAIRKRDPYQYPRGRTRLEPLALVIISVVMAVASIQVIVQSMDAVVSGDFMPNVHLLAILLMALTVALKLALFIVCRMQNRVMQDGSVAVLAQDHCNDCVSNTVAIACAYAGAHVWKYIDPLGAIVVSCYIAYTWFSTGYEQIRMLTGQSAPATFINRIINICTKHDVRIRSIDTVYCYHFGTRFLVEVHIVMDAEMSLRDSHDIGESLQCKLESLAYVERAFVHADYECDHRPEDEHTVV